MFVVFADDRDVAGFDAGRLDVIPIFMPVALADDEIDVIRKFFRIIEIETPLPIVIAVAEFARRAVRNTDLPDGLTAAGGGPLQFAEGFLFSGGDSEVGESEFSEDTVGDGVERVIAWANIPNREIAVGIGAGPELVKFGVALPIDLRWEAAASETGVGIGSSKTRTKAETESGRRRVVWRSDTDPDVAHFEIGSERIVQEELACDGGALGSRWIIRVG